MWSRRSYASPEVTKGKMNSVQNSCVARLAGEFTYFQLSEKVAHVDLNEKGAIVAPSACCLILATDPLDAS